MYGTQDGARDAIKIFPSSQRDKNLAKMVHQSVKHEEGKKKEKGLRNCLTLKRGYD